MNWAALFFAVLYGLAGADCMRIPRMRMVPGGLFLVVAFVMGLIATGALR